MTQLTNRIIQYIAIFLALLVVLPFHEFAHAFVAVKSGDMTPKLYNRYTLNPFAHFDIFGLLCFVLAHFGWAKPVPINPANFKHYRRDYLLVAVAGVIMNYIIAFIAYPLYRLTLFIPSNDVWVYFVAVIQLTFLFMFTLSINFFVFNLIPIFPLDGFRVVEALDRRPGKIFYFLKNYGVFILYTLILLSIIADFTNLQQINILGNYLSFVTNYVGKPITLFWGLFF